MSQVMIVHPGSTVSLISTLDAMRGFVRQSIHWSVGPSIRPTTRQPDKKQSQEIPKPRTYDFFPTARAAFIGRWLGIHLHGAMGILYIPKCL